MHLWIVFLSLVLSPTDSSPRGVGVQKDEPMRYRGIEQLLAKFEAEAGGVGP
jgi:hypothetical protein